MKASALVSMYWRNSAGAAMVVSGQDAVQDPFRESLHVLLAYLKGYVMRAEDSDQD
jgi:hypothetical protein